MTYQAKKQDSAQKSVIRLKKYGIRLKKKKDVKKKGVAPNCINCLS